MLTLSDDPSVVPIFLAFAKEKTGGAGLEQTFPVAVVGLARHIGVETARQRLLELGTRSRRLVYRLVVGHALVEANTHGTRVLLQALPRDDWPLELRERAEEVLRRASAR